MSKVSVLFVCMGNICRSPTAHGVFEKLVKDSDLQDEFVIDSAGTQAGHIGEAPDKRSMKVADGFGYDLSYIRSRKVTEKDFEQFDYIIAMDEDNIYDLNRKCPEEYKDKIHLMLEIGGIAESRGFVGVPDPYYGGSKGFDFVFDLVEESSKNLLDLIKKERLS